MSYRVDMKGTALFVVMVVSPRTSRCSGLGDGGGGAEFFLF